MLDRVRPGLIPMDTVKHTKKFRQDSTLPTFRVEVVVTEHGERYPLIVSRSSNLPLFSPCVWLTASRRVKGFAAGTLSNNAQTVASVYSWAVARDLDLEERIRGGFPGPLGNRRARRPPPFGGEDSAEAPQSPEVSSHGTCPRT